MSPVPFRIFIALVCLFCMGEARGQSLVSIAVTPSSSSVALNSSQPVLLTATGTYSDGSTNNVTASATWSSFNTAVAGVMPNMTSPNTEVVLPIGAGSTTITAAVAGVAGSATVTVLAPPAVTPPNINSVSPTAGTAGTQVTITGSGFGNSQGSGTVWLGTTSGTVVNWSDSQVVAAVASGSSSGQARIQQNGVVSNSISFTVNTPTIASVSPSSGIAGTEVTLTGSSFGATPGSAIVMLGNTPGIVSSWSDTQVVATVAAGSVSGNAQILQYGVWSNAIPFTTGIPQISGITPNSGGAGTQVTFSGSGFGASQGSGVAWLGNGAASVVSWSDTRLWPLWRQDPSRV